MFGINQCVLKRLSFAEETLHGRQQVVVALGGGGLLVFLHICASRILLWIF